MEPLSSQSEASIYTYMLRSHALLERLYVQVLDAMADDAPELRDLWVSLEHELRMHMDAEERFMLPTFARFDREEAIAILREHGYFREQLLELGVAIDLNLGCWEHSREFIGRLREHAGHEERLLYRWADQNLDARAVEAAIESREPPNGSG